MMNAELASYHKRELPGKWFYQIISFLRIDVPEGFTGANQTRNLISRDEKHVRHFVLHVGDILISHADIAPLTCSSQNRGFYEKCGWDFTRSLTVHVGSRKAPEEVTDEVALRCVSEKACNNHTAFVRTPIYFGEGLW